MNITFFSDMSDKEKAFSHIPELKEHKVRFFRLTQRAELLTDANSTEVLVVDAMGSADREIIDSMPQLRLIQSEGVGYQGFDVEYASSKGIAVCNNKGINDTAVAETAVLLMLSCLKSIITGHHSVYDGRQIEVKKASFGVVRELSECTVGLIGFGDIARACAKFCNAFGAKVLYTNRTRYTELEKEYNVTYCDMDTLLGQSDFVSLHLAATPETACIANKAFLSKMKAGAYLINTSRGELVDNEALLNALLDGTIAGAGLDVIYPEPVTADNPLLDDRIKDKLILTPHIAGITSLTVSRLFRGIWNNISAINNNTELKNKVN